MEQLRNIAVLGAVLAKRAEDWRKQYEKSLLDAKESMEQQLRSISGKAFLLSVPAGPEHTRRCGFRITGWRIAQEPPYIKVTSIPEWEHVMPDGRPTKCLFPLPKDMKNYIDAFLDGKDLPEGVTIEETPSEQPVPGDSDAADAKGDKSLNR